MALTIGIDVGGTKIAAGVVDESGEIITMVRKPTPASDAQSILNTILAVVAELRKVHDVEAIGVGAPGFIDTSRSTVIFAPNVSWRNEPLAEKIASATGLPTILENDANAAAWGEFRFGAAKGRSSAVIITVGTGIGGGIILGDQLLRGSYGFAGEIGHMNMVPDGQLCGCGERGCWEMYSAGTALVNYARTQAAESSERGARLIELAGGEPTSISGLHITQAAREGDTMATACFAEVGKWLGQGMADLAAILDPDVFVLSGGVSEAGDLLLSPAREQFEERLTARDFRPVPPIVLAQRRNEAGIIGAADLARQPR